MSRIPLKISRRFKFFLLTSGIVILIDHLTKWIIRTRMYPNQTIKVIDDFFTITFIYNTGIAFGIFNKNNSPAKIPILIAISIVALAVIMYIFISLPKNIKLSGLSMGLIFGGAIGNIIDRILRGKVVDFFDFDFFDINIPKLGIHMTRFATFNVADTSVFIGITMLFIIILIYGGKIEEKQG